MRQKAECIIQTGLSLVLIHLLAGSYTLEASGFAQVPLVDMYTLQVFSPSVCFCSWSGVFSTSFVCYTYTATYITLLCQKIFAPLSIKLNWSLLT